MGKIKVIKAPKPKKRAFLWGIIAEWLAMLWLMTHGYKIIKHRHRSKHGEIDIIAEKNRMLVFVEVKARKEHDTALLSIGPRQMIRIERAAKSFAARGIYVKYDMRFDVITCTPWSMPRHLPDAWRPLG